MRIVPVEDRSACFFQKCRAYSRPAHSSSTSWTNDLNISAALFVNCTAGRVISQRGENFSARLSPAAFMFLRSVALLRRKLFFLCLQSQAGRDTKRWSSSDCVSGAPHPGWHFWDCTVKEESTEGDLEVSGDKIRESANAEGSVRIAWWMRDLRVLCKRVCEIGACSSQAGGCSCFLPLVVTCSSTLKAIQ